MIQLNKKGKFKMNKWLVFIIGAIMIGLGVHDANNRYYGTATTEFIIGVGMFINIFFTAMMEDLNK